MWITRLQMERIFRIEKNWYKIHLYFIWYRVGNDVYRLNPPPFFSGIFGGRHNHKRVWCARNDCAMGVPFYSLCVVVLWVMVTIVIVQWFVIDHKMSDMEAPTRSPSVYLHIKSQLGRLEWILIHSIMYKGKQYCTNKLR